MTPGNHTNKVDCSLQTALCQSTRPFSHVAVGKGSGDTRLSHVNDSLSLYPLSSTSVLLLVSGSMCASKYERDHQLICLLAIHEL